MKQETFEELVDSLKEAVAIRKGEIDASSTIKVGTKEEIVDEGRRLKAED